MSGPPPELRARLVQAAFDAALAEGRFAAPKARRAISRARLYRDGRLTLLAPYFDYAYYAHENPDFAASGLDELEHFNFFGWRALRNPAAWFDTAYYLASNPDVLASGDNPFWHYVFKGRAEGRAPRRPRGRERAILDRIGEADETPAPDLPRLDVGALAARLSGAAGLVYEVVADGAGPAEEAAALKAMGFLVLTAAPRRPSAALGDLPPVWAQTRLALDGEPLGVAADAQIAEALASLGEARPARRAMVVRGAQGASAAGLLAVAAALAPQRRIFCLDDLSTLCPSPQLLRNDVAYCAAPPQESQACAICAHGETRPAHLTAMRRLFERVGFTALAPSEAALAFWLAKAGLPHEAARVAAPLTLETPQETPATIAEIAEIGAEGRPVRVAFIGAPTLERGWLTFERVLEACGELAAYAFHHFAPAHALRPSHNLFSVATEGETPAPMIERRIDLVVAASAGPEAFSRAAMEAIAAGADIVTLGCSGHAAELAKSLRRGRVLANDDEIVDFFVSGKAIAYARERARFPRLIQSLRVETPVAALIGVEGWL